MNEMYSEVREALRRQHAMNRQEVRGKNIGGYYRYRDYDREQEENDTLQALTFKGKIVVFLLSVMLFSCYLYGGQDIKKGAVMAWNDINTQITKLEEEEPAVKQTMDYIRNAYSEIKDFAETYMGLEIEEKE